MTPLPLGNEHAHTHLLTALREGKLSHAYLFVGPSGIGKYTLALHLAELLTTGDPFRHISIRRLYREGTDEDLTTLSLSTTLDQSHRIKQKAKTDTLGIEDITALRERLARTKDGPQAITLYRAERLTPPAAESLLKLLEEPPSHTHFFLTTENATSVPATIRSRCCILTFSPLTDSTLRTHLTAHYPHLTPADIDRITALSLGRIGTANSLAENPDLLLTYSAHFIEAKELLEKASPLLALRIAEKNSKTREDAHLVLTVFTHLLYRLMHQKSLRGENSGRLSPARLASHLDALAAAEDAIAHQVTPRLVLEKTLLTLCQ